MLVACCRSHRAITNTHDRSLLLQRSKLEKDAEMLNAMMNDDADEDDNPKAPSAGSSSQDEDIEARNEKIMDLLTIIYERLDDMDATTAEMRARKILSGLGFTTEMQSKATKEVS